jgi:hypothetical protein
MVTFIVSGVDFIDCREKKLSHVTERNQGKKRKAVFTAFLTQAQKEACSIQSSQGLMLVTCVIDVPGSNLGWDTILKEFSSVPPRNS